MSAIPTFVRRLPAPVRPVQERRPASKPLPSEPSLMKRWFGRREPSTYQRCLAIHIHYAAPRSALS